MNCVDCNKWLIFSTNCFPPSALFSVMCYNVLCDKYATRQLYGYCPSWALNWEYRKKSIMQEILSCNADIISLQVSNDTEVLEKNVCINGLTGRGGVSEVKPNVFIKHI